VVTGKKITMLAALGLVSSSLIMALLYWN